MKLETWDWTAAALAAVLAGWLIDPAAAADRYVEFRSAAVKQCEAVDRSEYQTGLGFRIERNGNGRDFDILPAFDPGYAHGYSLRFELTGAGPAAASVPVAASGFYLRGNENIRIFVPRAELRQRFTRFEMARPYRVRGTLILDVGNGGQSGMWSNAFIEHVFPVANRSQSLVREATF